MNDFYDGVVAETMGLIGGITLALLMIIGWAIGFILQQQQQKQLFATLGGPIGDVKADPRKERASSVGKAFRDRLHSDFGGKPWA